jgi:DNA modification methylase
MKPYDTFLNKKAFRFESAGISVDENEFPSALYPFQRRLTSWALKKGKAALWADTGLGKTFMQVSWAERIPGRVLIVAPLCVSIQTITEAKKLGIEIGDRIQITNYERLHQVNPSDYTGIVLDESSILKSVDGKTRTRLIEMFQQTPYRLCCTATPAPNDIAELANHCEFLGVMSRVEMLATFFVHDETGWRLKGHAREGFYQWLASWGMFLRKPSDLGFSDEGYILPELRICETVVSQSTFALGLRDGIRGRLKARRDSLDSRVEMTRRLVSATGGQWICWCGLNDEQDKLAALLGEDCVSVSGNDSIEEKEKRIARFLSGDVRVLVTKPKIAGFGLNLQQCSQIVFVGIGDSFESYYQAIRRCWRFGQTRPVHVSIVVSDAELGIVQNVKRKEAEHNEMAKGLMNAMRKAEMVEIGATKRESASVEKRVEKNDNYELYLGDCIEVMGELPEESVDLSVYSPPFASLYTYSATDHDLGNCKSRDEFLEHFGYAVRGLLRITKPGRVSCCHISQVASTLVTHGVIGLIDLRGAVIECFGRNGWVYHGDVCIDKNPQAQAIRTHAKGLLFAQLRKDASWLRPGLADYILVFRKPGENEVPIEPDISNEDWIEWAHPVWYGIRESDTLNAREARSEEDERHMCPLQLGVIERCVRLWSNKGETVFSPFAGIGSEGFGALREGRKFVGVELKREYFEMAIRNLNGADIQQPLFALQQEIS